MCIVCIELTKQTITYPEAQNGLKEMIISTKDGDKLDHYELLDRSLREADLDTLDELLGEG